MKRKEILREGLYAGAALAVLFWIAELFFCLLVELPSLASRRYTMSMDMGDIVRSLPIYLLFCLVLGAFLERLWKDLSFIYTALLVAGVSLFEWASHGEGALRVLGGAPWVRREIWIAALVFLGYLWWSCLRRKTTEEIRGNGISAFLILPLFLIAGQRLSMEFDAIPLLNIAPPWRNPGKPIWVYGALAMFVFLSFSAFFLIRRGIMRFMKMKKLQGTIVGFSLFISFFAYLPRWLPVVSSDERPNIILIVLDTVRADRLSSYGYPKQTTPYFDRLSKEGALFEEAKANSHWTLPSHVSLFTGLLPSRHGVVSMGLKVRGDYEMLAEQLRTEGYRTVGVSANPLVGRERGLDRGFDQFVELGLDSQRSLAKRVQTRFGRQSCLDAPSVTLFLDHWLAYQNYRDRRPFFLFVNYLDAHVPYRFHPGISELFFAEPWSRKEIASLDQNHTAFFAGELTYSEKELRLQSNLYDGEIAYLDRFWGEWTEALRRKGLLDKSVLVVTSDHGEYFGEHHLLGHIVGLYEETVHVPLLMRYPKEIPAARIEMPVQLADIPPTLLELARLRGPESIEGRSLVPLFGSRPDWEHRLLVAEQHPNTLRLERLKWLYPDANFDSYSYSAYAFQEGQYKSILFSNRSPELYDLGLDRKESQNLYQTFQDHPIWARVAGYLEEREKKKSITSTDSVTAMKAMRSLGYL